jgi:integrase
MSVRKRTWTTAKGEEKTAWVVDYIDRMEGGTRRLKTFTKKKEADAFAAKASVEVRAGIHTADSASVTIAEAGKKWIEAAEGNGLERSTVAAYKQHLRLHIEPYLGAVKLSQLSVPMVREFEEKLARGDMPNGADPQPRSRAMVRKVRVSLSSLLSDAQERGLIAHNVVRDLGKNRKRGKERAVGKREKGKLKIGVDIPEPAEIKAIVQAAEGRWRPLLLTAIFTGLRASELRGLRWDDVDLDKRELHVRQRADRYSDIGKPKSASGERTVPLTPIVVNTLREWKLACPKSKEGLVFPSSGGRIEHHSNIVTRGLVPTLIKAGVTVNEKGSDGKEVERAKYTGLHALRHFYASWCINRRVDGGLELPAKVVQERLGHSSIVMTLDVYGHLFKGGDDSELLASAERSLLAWVRHERDTERILSTISARNDVL